MELFKYAIAAFAIALFFNALFLNSPGFPEASVGGHKVLSGGVLYRDSWEMHAPGQFYLWAFLFRLFGESLLVQKAAAAVANAIGAVLFLLLALRFVPERRTALALSAFYAIFSLAFVGELFITHVTYIAVLNMAGLLFASKFVEEKEKNKKLGWLAAAGLAFGIEMVFKQNAGPYSLAALGIFLLLDAWKGGKTPVGKLGTNPTGSNWNFILPAASHIIIAVLSFAAAIVPIALYFYSNGALGDLAEQLFSNNLTSYVATESVLPAITAPIWLFAEVLAFATALAILSRKYALEHRLLALVSINGLFSLLLAFPRYADAALMNSLAPILLCGAFLAQSGELRQNALEFLNGIKGQFRKSNAARISAAVLLLLFAFNAVVVAAAGVKTAYRSERLAGYALHGNYSYLEYSDVADYLRTAVPPGEKIFVWGYYPDVYLYSQKDWTKYSFFLPNAISGERRQREIISELERQDVRFIAFKQGAQCEKGTVTKLFTYEQALVDCREMAPILYGYIWRNYSEIKSFTSGFQLLAKK